jgi:class 3 adenylate cyclase
MKSQSNCHCSNDNNCKDEINKAKKFVNKLGRDDRDTYTVAHFDLKGSTKLMQADAYSAITKMLLHNKICRNIIEKNDGTIIKELGDAVMVTFKGTGKACECAIKIIRNLKKHEKEIRTKVTISHGTLWNIKTTNDDDVYGEPVNRCTRMSKYAKEDCILFEEKAYTTIQYYLQDDTHIKYRKVKCNKKDRKVECDGNDIILDDFGSTPMRKIIVC